MRFRVAPQAVCRQLLANMDSVPTLTPDEQVAVLRAIENSQVPDAIERLLATLSRGTISELLERF